MELQKKLASQNVNICKQNINLKNIDAQNNASISNLNQQCSFSNTDIGIEDKTINTDINPINQSNFITLYNIKLTYQQLYIIISIIIIIIILIIIIR